MRKYRSLEERIAANSVIDDSTCWLWIGNVDRDGYGRITLRIDGRHRKIRAHRLTYELACGVVLDRGDHIDHLCGNKRCINPDHLSIVTNEENLKRRWTRYRMACSGTDNI